eukprot:Selendium_serpulae@DN8162_c0_g1_i1.p2
MVYKLEEPIIKFYHGQDTNAFALLDKRQDVETQMSLGFKNRPTFTKILGTKGRHIKFKIKHVVFSWVRPNEQKHLAPEELILDRNADASKVVELFNEYK